MYSSSPSVFGRSIKDAISRYELSHAKQCMVRGFFTVVIHETQISYNSHLMSATRTCLMR